MYDPVFKTKAVQLSNERTNTSELAREHGIKVILLYKWHKEYEVFNMQVRNLQIPLNFMMLQKA
ncbi:transposase [Chryseobacterium muglaense]|uniref:Transposase n=1 Tax=Chryseobacterium muglaense TaxID=2893752 RepID=A0ABR8M476_9FLAO|nr:transposase [Chryseobacterium muglaense]